MPPWPASAVDLKNAVVVSPRNLTGPESKAVTVLVEEVEKRTQMRLPVQNAMPEAGKPAIVVGTTAKLANVAGSLLRGMIAAPHGDEGFRVETIGGHVVVAGNDQRGMLFGVGYLLRNMRMEGGHILEAPDDLKIATAPRFKLRGHQLGYRPKVNAYDAFTVPMFA